MKINIMKLKLTALLLVLYTGLYAQNKIVLTAPRLDTSSLSNRINLKANTNLNNVNGVLSSTYGGAGDVTGILKANGLGTVSAAVNNADFTLLNGTGFVRMSGTTPSYLTGASSQFVKADGSLDGNTYATTSALSGTTNYIPKFTSSTAIGNSIIREGSNSIGIGRTPSSWSITPSLQIEVASIYNQGDDGTYFTSNGVYNSGWKYIATSTATQYSMILGAHRWYTAPSGTIGNAISWTERLNLSSTTLTSYVPVSGTSLSMSGEGLFGGAITDGTNKLKVTGPALFSSSVTASSLIKSGGTSSQFLKADGSVDNNTYLTSLSNLSAGSGLIGTAYNGSAAQTFRVDTGRAADKIVTGGTLNKVRDSITNAIATSVTTRKIIGSSSAPSISGGSATYIGTGASTSVSGNDMAGEITLITGTGCASTGASNRSALSVTFSSAYATAPIVQIQAIQQGGLSSTDGPTNQTFFLRRDAVGTNGFTVYLPVGTTLTDSTTYLITYQVIGR